VPSAHAPVTRVNFLEAIAPARARSFSKFVRLCRGQIV
jgi:hypothetical protein